MLLKLWDQLLSKVPKQRESFNITILKKISKIIESKSQAIFEDMTPDCIVDLSICKSNDKENTRKHLTWSQGDMVEVLADKSILDTLSEKKKIALILPYDMCIYQTIFSNDEIDTIISDNVSLPLETCYVNVLSYGPSKDKVNRWGITAVTDSTLENLENSILEPISERGSSIIGLYDRGTCILASVVNKYIKDIKGHTGIIFEWLENNQCICYLFYIDDTRAFVLASQSIVVSPNKIDEMFLTKIVYLKSLTRKRFHLEDPSVAYILNKGHEKTALKDLTETIMSGLSLRKEDVKVYDSKTDSIEGLLVCLGL